MKYSRTQVGEGQNSDRRRVEFRGGWIRLPWRHTGQALHSNIDRGEDQGHQQGGRSSLTIPGLGRALAVGIDTTGTWFYRNYQVIARHPAWPVNNLFYYGRQVGRLM